MTAWTSNSQTSGGDGPRAGSEDCPVLETCLIGVSGSCSGQLCRDISLEALVLQEE